MKLEQSRPAMLTATCLASISVINPIATINSVTQPNDRTRGGKELLAFVDSGAVDDVLPKSVCAEYPLEGTSKSTCFIALGIGSVSWEGDLRDVT